MNVLKLRGKLDRVSVYIFDWLHPSAQGLYNKDMYKCSNLIGWAIPAWGTGQYPRGIRMLGTKIVYLNQYPHDALITKRLNPKPQMAF